MASILSNDLLERLSALLSVQMGLYFPKERWGDLERGVAGAARDMGFPDAASCAGSIVDATLTQQQIETLASHLTVPETYFFREPAPLRVLETVILPELIRQRRGKEQRLRFWSAGCSSGEEPYTLAIMLYRMLPDLKEWHVTILGTDISPRALQKARAGTYSNWSFRGTPSWLKELFFRPAGPERYEISPQIRQMVSFSYLNLARYDYPSLVSNTNAMDLILCRNVLMYFEPRLAQQVVQKLHKSLLDGGWLVVSPAEVSNPAFVPFQGVSFTDATLYLKGASPPFSLPPAEPPEESPFEYRYLGESPEEATPPVFASAAERDPVVEGAALYRTGRYSEAAAALKDAVGAGGGRAEEYSLLVRSYANQGELDQALYWCEKAVSRYKLTAEFHYLRAVILQEKGDLQEARISLQRALYLDPNLVLAHFALGNLALAEGKGRAGKHFANALALLKGMPPEATLPESEGMTAGRLSEVIHSLMVR